MKGKRLVCVIAALAVMVAVPFRVSGAEDEPVSEDAAAEPAEYDIEADAVEIVTDAPETAAESFDETVVSGYDDGYSDGYEAGYQAAYDALRSETESGVSGSVEYDSRISFPENEYSDGSINVVVPSAGNIILNPYGLPVANDFGTSTDQLICDPLEIESYSSVPVNITVSATGEFAAESSARIVSVPPADDEPEKQYYIWFEFISGEAVDSDWSGEYTDAPNQILTNGEERTVLTLPAVEDAPATGAFRAFGIASKNPSEPWDPSDLFTISLTYTFTNADADGAEE